MGKGLTTAEQPYTLKLSEAELARYRTMAAVALEAELDTWTEAGIRRGARVADIGCGPAIILAELAQLVGPEGHVDGIDRDADARATAEAYLHSREIVNADIIAGEATNTGLAAGTYDTVMMRHVLLHNGPTMIAILKHLGTLLKPDGRLVLAEIDLEAMRTSPPSADLEEERQAWLELLRRHGNDVMVGAHLASVVSEAGLEVVSFKGNLDVHWLRDVPDVRPAQVAAREAILAAGLATAEDAARWDAAWRAWQADPRDAYTCVSTFVAVARPAN